MRFTSAGVAGLYRDFDTSYTHQFSVVDATANTITIRTGGSAWPAGYKLVVMTQGGANVAGQLVYYNPLGAQDTTATPIHTVAADFLLGVSSFANHNTITSGSELSLGLALSKLNQRSTYWGQPNLSTPSFNKGRVSDDRFGFVRYLTDGVTSTPARIILNALTPSGAEILIRQGSVNRPFFYLAIKSGGVGLHLDTVSIPTSSGSPTSVNTGFDVAAVIGFPVSMTATGNSDDEIGGIGLYLGDGTDEYTAMLTSIAGQATQDTKSEVVTGLSARDETGAKVFDCSVTSVTDGAQISTTTTVSASYLVNMLFIGGTSGSGTPPVTLLPNAGFAYWPSYATAGSPVDFTDLSNGNGETITEWVWDFNDGFTESSTIDGDVSHTFAQAGSYAVKLTVTTSAGSSSRTINITINDKLGPPTVPGDFEYLTWGPPKPQPITEDTESGFVLDPTRSDAAHLTLSVDFGSLPITYNTERLAIKPDKGNIGVVGGNLVIRRPDGAVATIANLTFTPVTPPVAAFSGDSTSIEAGDTVSFTNGSTNYESSLWDFGDGSQGSAADDPSHQYTDVGDYDVTLTVTNQYGDTNTLFAPAYISVDPPGLPTAEFSVDDVTVNVDVTVTFTDASTNATSWLWDFGDSSGTSTLQNPTYTYDTAGSYTVSLTAYNIELAESTETKVDYITVSNWPAPVAAFSADDVSPAVDDTVTFTDASTGATSWLWDFGDSSGTSTLQNPTHVYTSAGTYTVTLTAYNPQLVSDVEAKTGYITATTGGTVNLTVAQEAREVLDGSVSITDDPIITSSGAHWVALRFTSVAIPQGATITVADLRVDVLNTANDDPNWTTHAELAVNSAALTTANDSIETRSLTTASANWNNTGIGAGMRSHPDLSAVIEEVVGQGSWASGNALTIIVDCNAGTNFDIVKGNTTLDITYSG